MSSSSSRNNPSARGLMVLKSLFEADGSLSGEDMARGLGITRSALWKLLGTLRERGFIIEGKKGTGYRLLETPDMSAEGIMASVRGPMGRAVIYRDAVDSTNELAMRLAGEGAPHGTVMVADAQSKGRGRQGRPWVSSPGKGLLMSVILRPEMSPEEAPRLTYLCSLSAVLGIRRVTGADVRLKWPNDLMIGDRKLGGLLIEMRTEPGAVLYAVAGFGINVSARVSQLHPSIREIATSLLIETGEAYKRSAIAVAILDEISLALEESPDAIMGQWKSLCTTLGREITVTGMRGTITGMAYDIDSAGRLLVRACDGVEHAVSSGDVTLAPSLSAAGR